jgi:hypothetical protein
VLVHLALLLLVLLLVAAGDQLLLQQWLQRRQQQGLQQQRRWRQRQPLHGAGAFQQKARRSSTMHLLLKRRLQHFWLQMLQLVRSVRCCRGL